LGEQESQKQDTFVIMAEKSASDISFSDVKQFVTLEHPKV